MRNRRFDDAILGRIQGESIALRPDSAARILDKVREGLRVRKMPRAGKIRPVRLAMAIAAALTLLFGTAFAAMYWGSRELITHQDRDGTVYVNEALVSQIQPVDEQVETETLSIDIIDSVFDGNVLTAAWMLTNNESEEIYLLGEVRVNGRLIGGGYYTNVGEIFIAPGDTVRSGISARVDGMDIGAADENCAVELYFTAFLPKGEIVKMSDPGEADALIAQGKIPVAPDGVIEMGSAHIPDAAKTPAENLLASGLMTQAGTAEAAFSVQRSTVSASSPSVLPVEKDNGTYILRVTQADISLNSAVFKVERVFANLEAAQQYREYYEGGKLSPGWFFYFTDETGDIWWSQASGGQNDTDEPLEQPDGTFVWGYTAQMTNLSRIPTRILIVPARDDTATGKIAVQFPEEAVELTFASTSE